MNRKKKVLLLSNSEICYNPRLAKAADSFFEKGYDVDVFNPIIGMADLSVYKRFIKNKYWEIREFDISKQNFKSNIKWLLTGIINKFFLFLYKKFNSNIGFEYIKNKGLIGFNKNKKEYDIIIIHLVDSLPFAAKLKKKYNNAILIYDSQEFFTGQYSKSKNNFEKKWVACAEEKYIHSADIVLTTTRVMKDRLFNLYNLKVPIIRVRNLPKTKNEIFLHKEDSIVRFVWHGMRIFFENERGVHILLKAFAISTSTNIELYIQGYINEEEKEKVNNFCKKNNIEDKVFIVPSASPDKIVESITKYDVGLLGELPVEENQRLTSSNKLFEYISAGLAIIVPNILGIAETINEYQIGEKYSPGNIKELAKKIDLLANDKEFLDKSKNKSKSLSKESIFWDNDYKYVIKEIAKKH